MIKSNATTENPAENLRREKDRSKFHTFQFIRWKFLIFFRLQSPDSGVQSQLLTFSAPLRSFSDKRVTKTTRDLARDHLAPLYTPGPGTYGHDVECNRQACNKWPRMFDRPVARELRPELTPKALRTEMTDDQGGVLYPKFFLH